MRASSPAAFREALLGVAPIDRDAWVDRALGLESIPADGADLPQGCVPYLPCSVDALLRLVDAAPVRANDVFVDLGCGVGRAAALVHLLTGASVVGVEIQRAMVDAARALCDRVNASAIECVHGDAALIEGAAARGTAFFLYCPFGAERVQRVSIALDSLARTRPIRVCCVDVRLVGCESLVLDPELAPDLAIYRSAQVQ